VPSSRRTARPASEREQRVLRDFLDADGHLKEIPTQQKSRLVILRWLAGNFAPGVRYSEAEVKQLLSRYHPDHATLRRELVDAELMQRQSGTYWRTGSTPAGPPSSAGPPRK
jgi:hypothetical protein